MVNVLVGIVNNIVVYIDCNDKEEIEKQKKLLESLNSKNKYHIIEVEDNMVKNYKENAQSLNKDYEYLKSV